MSFSEEKLLWASVAAGDHRAFTELFDRYWEPFLQYSFKILQDREESEELVQELFIYIWHKKEELPELQSVQAYLFTMLRNRILNLLAKNKVRRKKMARLLKDTTPSDGSPALTDSGGEPGCNLERKSSEGVIRDMAAQLPSRMQEVYMLHQFSDLSIAEIASATGNSEQTIRNQFNIALKKLGASYKKHLHHFFTFF